MKTPTYKAQRHTIHISDVPLEVAMLPDGSYVFSQTEVAAVKDVNKIGTISWEVVNWVRDALDSPTELAAVQEIKRLGYGFDNECWLQVKLLDSFWVLP